jgi:hypothetical protein
MRMFGSVAGLFLLLLVASPSQAGQAIFRFNTLVGVPNPPVTIRDIAGGGAAWTLSRGEARLDEDGRFEVEVQGLVLVSTGVNPIPQFMATLSCMDAQGVTQNISTAPVPVGPNGDARIRATLTPPTVCLAPIVFVRAGLPTNTRWFAVSGF